MLILRPMTQRSIGERLRRFYRDYLVGVQPRTYETACAELGGVPWREHEGTERWFLDDILPSNPVDGCPPPVERVSWGQKSASWLGGAGAVLGVLMLFLAVRPASGDAGVPSSEAPAPPPIASAVVTRQADAPAEARRRTDGSRLASSVRALFDGKSAKVRRSAINRSGRIRR